MGFLELVERDAVAIWWYNRIIRPAIDPDYFNDPELDECVHWMKRHHRLLYTLDLTHDYDIPVIAAISVNSEETDIAMGFGANFDYLSALKSAIREMLQLYALKRIIERQIAAGGVVSLDQSARSLISWTRGNFVKAYPHMRPGGIKPPPEKLRSLTRPRDSEEALQSCAALCRKKKSTIFYIGSYTTFVQGAGCPDYRAWFAPL